MTPEPHTDRPAPPPVALTIAGSDPSGGAGVQADLKTFSALGAYGCAVLTALTAQSTRGVDGVHAVPPEFVAQQLRTLLDDVHVDAVKIGMLATAPVVETVAGVLTERPHDVVVLDPVMVSTSGHRLLDDDAVAAVRALLPAVSLVTPNVPEAAHLLGTEPARDLDGMREQADAIRGLGVPHVLLKGGHLDGAEAVDVLVGPEGATVLRAPRVATSSTHGTGCALSSALAVLRTRHGTWADAARAAKEWLTGALQAADRLAVGHGHGPVHHFHAVWPA